MAAFPARSGNLCFRKDGIVTLTGQVDSYAKKLEAKQAAKKVFGVKAVAY